MTTLTELSLHPISNYRRTAIRGGSSLITGRFPSFISPVGRFHYFTGVRQHIPQVWQKVRICLLYVPPFPRCVRAKVPSAGFLLSLLRGPQRLLIIPDLLALHFSSSHSGPLQLTRVSSLLTCCLPHCACPLARSK